MPYVKPPPDYVLTPADQFRLVLSVGFIQPPLWVVESVMRYNGYELIEAAYMENDLVIVGRLLPADPDAPQIIAAKVSVFTGWVVGLLAAAGVGIAGLLWVKDFHVWRNDAGEWHFETETSLFGSLTMLAFLGLGALWLTRK